MSSDCGNQLESGFDECWRKGFCLFLSERKTGRHSLVTVTELASWEKIMSKFKLNYWVVPVLRLRSKKPEVVIAHLLAGELTRKTAWKVNGALLPCAYWGLFIINNYKRGNSYWTPGLSQAWLKYMFYLI